MKFPIEYFEKVDFEKQTKNKTKNKHKNTQKSRQDSMRDQKLIQSIYDVTRKKAACLLVQTTWINLYGQS